MSKTIRDRAWRRWIKNKNTARRMIKNQRQGYSYTYFTDANGDGRVNLLWFEMLETYLEKEGKEFSTSKWETRHNEENKYERCKEKESFRLRIQEFYRQGL